MTATIYTRRTTTSPEGIPTDGPLKHRPVRGLRWLNARRGQVDQVTIKHRPQTGTWQLVVWGSIRLDAQTTEHWTYDGEFNSLAILDTYVAARFPAATFVSDPIQRGDAPLRSYAFAYAFVDKPLEPITIEAADYAHARQQLAEQRPRLTHADYLKPVLPLGRHLAHPQTFMG